MIYFTCKFYINNCIKQNHLKCSMNEHLLHQPTAVNSSYFSEVDSGTKLFATREAPSFFIICGVVLGLFYKRGNFVLIICGVVLGLFYKGGTFVFIIYDIVLGSLQKRSTFLLRYMLRNIRDFLQRTHLLFYIWGSIRTSLQGKRPIFSLNVVQFWSFATRNLVVYCSFRTELK